MSGGSVVSVSLDETVRVTPVDAADLGAPTKLESAPRDSATQGDTTLTACAGKLVLTRGASKLFTLPVAFEAISVSLHPSGAEAAVGSGEGKIHLYTVTADTLVPAKVLDASGPVEAVAYSPGAACWD